MKKKGKVIIQLVIILGIGFASLWVTSFFTKESSKEEIAEEVIKKVKEVIIKRPSCPKTTDAFKALKDSGQVVALVENLNSYGENGVFINSKAIVVNSTGSGSQIACGYLYIRVHGENGRPIQLDWEHPYIKPGQFGGHLETDTSIIPSQDGKTNELLFNLAEMNYRLSNSDTEIRKADWVALLNVNNQTKFGIAFNTIDKTVILDEVLIIYECWNPETGQVTHDCRLSIE